MPQRKQTLTLNERRSIFQEKPLSEKACIVFKKI